MTENTLDRCSKKLLHECLGIESNEELGIVFDRRTNIVESLEQVASTARFTTRQIEIPVDREHSAPIPEAGEELQACDVIVAPTEHSISHSPETTKARESSGTRFLTLPGITEEIYRKIGKADVEEIDRFNRDLREQIGDAESVRIQTPSGTDVSLSLDPDHRPWHEDNMTVHEPGELANAPAGELFTAPLENGADGRIVIDRWQDVTSDDGAELELSDGRIVDGNEAAKPLLTTLRSGGNAGLVIAELGLGTNKSHEKPIGNILHDEKIHGTCHIAFGMNTSFGGDNEADVHQDVILLDPDIYCDSEPLRFPG